MDFWCFSCVAGLPTIELDESLNKICHGCSSPDDLDHSSRIWYWYDCLFACFDRCKNYDHPNEVMKWARELIVDFLLNILPNWPQYSRTLHHQAAERFQYFTCDHYLYCQSSLNVNKNGFTLYVDRVEFECLGSCTCMMFHMLSGKISVFHMDPIAECFGYCTC